MRNRFIALALLASILLSGACTQSKVNLYSFEIMGQGDKVVPVDSYRGDVVLIVNSASRCGFTPQYSELEGLYEKYRERGFEILDFPCNQFGGQSPESDEETTQFCQLNYGTQFAQLKEIEVNGPNESPLYTWLKSQKGFEGFDKDHPRASVLNERLLASDPDYASKPDIKWNFTKFLIDRKGDVVARFEPTADMEEIEKIINELL